jgi:methylmalonyl-CoA/ethylmalonyl-CoA epimerase
MEFDHAGVATDDCDALVDLYGDLFDAPLVHEEVFDGLRVAFLGVGTSYFELLEPLPGAGGAIATYLERDGPGIHHVALRTDDAAAALETARAAGAVPIDDDPRPGAWGHDVAFLHPDSTGGVLVEFVER